MTREEEIHKIANTISTNIGKDVDEDYICNDEYDFTIGFECGTKWADEHPNLCKEEQVGMNELGMMWQKQALIKKACEWLENIDFASEYFYDDEGFFENAILVEEFKKAMEE